MKWIKKKYDMMKIIPLFFVALAFILPQYASAMPVFARQYNVSCTTCHAAFPRLNSYGKQFLDNNIRMPNWRETATDVGDEKLVLSKQIPLAIRAQAYIQSREGKEIDPINGPTGNDSSFDFQGPYLVKLLSSAPLSEHISYYFYGIFAEKGSNSEVIIEDAWFSYYNLLDTDLNIQFGQFQISDIMFPRENRMTFQDFMAYRMAGITYDRGILFSREIGPLQLDLGIVNGNGITQNFNVNSPGYRRPDHLFDNDTSKTVFGRIGTELNNISFGLFGLLGKQKSIGGPAGTVTGVRDTDKRILGFDASGDMDEKVYWFVQVLWNQWDGFLDSEPNKDFNWLGGFAGIDYIYNKQWVFSMLYNYADANDFKDTGTVYEGIDINTLTVAASYYFMRNVKGIIEINADFIQKDNDADFVGHETKEGYILIGMDASF